MEESGYSCSSASGGCCCLSLPETILVLVVLTIVVQLGLKLASVICYYLWYLIGVMYGMVVVQDPKKLKAHKIPVLKAKSSALWSFQDVPRRQPRKESRSPSHRCLHCTLEPLKVTMNLQNEAVPYPARSRRYANYPPYLPRYYNYDYESRPRPRRASAPSAYAVRYRDANTGSSDPIMGVSGGNTPERRSTATGTELVPRKRTAETQRRRARPGPDTQPPDASPRSRRPAKVYIYPVHPQTPPGSRSSSPERPRRRRRRKGQATSQEEQTEPEARARASRRKTREVEQQTFEPATLYPHGGSTNIAQGTVPPESPVGKPRYYWSDQVSGADWVYQ